MALQTELIDITLRDGSNAVNFQFSKEDTAEIVSGLSKAGIRWIEVGHGLGLGAGERTGKPAKETDEVYIRTAAEKAGPAKIGCFFIEGIGKMEDLAKAQEWGLDFIRVGPNAVKADVEAIGPYVRKAKKLGLIVHACVRKAYGAEPNQLAEFAKRLEAFGADNLIVMDSAGTMLPNQVKEYVFAVKDCLRGACAMKVGFHAHNNLALAAANSLAAVEAGADTVDTCLKGIGRSAGNASTETMAAIFSRMGVTAADVFALQDLAEDLIGDKAYRTFDSTALVFGMAGFHSSFYPMVERMAEEYQVDPRRLVIRLCGIEQIAPTLEQARRAAEDLVSAG